jgi:uncharacterized membrane protein YphA (DoxX/SURF4 family)
VAWAFVSSAIAITVLIAGASKLVRVHRFELILRQHSWIPVGVIPPLARAIPALEVTLGTLVLLGLAAPLPLIGLVVLLVLFTTAIGASVLRGNTDVQCGCHSGSTDRVDGRFFVRNVLLIAGAAAAVEFGDTGVRVFGATTLNSTVEAVVVQAVAFAFVVLVLNLKTLRTVFDAPRAMESGGERPP